jgi:hypothetical protein
MTDSRSTPLSELDDYVSGAMSDADAGAFEEALFAGAARGESAEAEFAEGLRRAAEWIGKHASFNVGSTREEVDALRASGARVTYLDFGAGGVVDVPAFPPVFDYLVYRLGVDLRGYDAVDVRVETPDGELIKTFRDVRYDPNEGALYGICHAPLAELSFRRGVAVSKVMAGHGAERKLIATFETRPAGA